MDTTKYKKLLYIHNIDKTCYFKIPITFNQDNVINYITYVIDTTYSGICGFKDSINIELLIETNRCWYDNNKSVLFGYTISSGRYDFVVSGKGYVKMNGTEISQEKENAEDWDIGYICIGTNDRTGATSNQNFIGCVLYDTLNDYNNGIFSHSFIPCKRLEDNTIGVYDLVTDNFYLPTRGKWIAPLDFSEVTTIQIPEGEVQRIEDSEGHLLWTKPGT